MRSEPLELTEPDGEKKKNRRRKKKGKRGERKTVGGSEADSCLHVVVLLKTPPPQVCVSPHNTSRAQILILCLICMEVGGCRGGQEYYGSLGMCVPDGRRQVR